jgi:hypothetical protein
MTAIANRLSTSQIARFLKQTRTTDGTYALVHIIEGEPDGETLAEGTLESARIDDDWPQAIMDSVQDHADSLSAGLHRYALRGTDEDTNRTVATSWFRWRVKERDANRIDSDGAPVESVQYEFTKLVLGAVKERDATINGLVKTMQEQLKAQSEMVRAMMTRTTQVEADNAELQKENLEFAAASALRVDRPEEDPVHELLKLAVSVGADKLTTQMAPQIAKLMGLVDPTAAAKALPSDHAPAATETESAPVNPD